MANETATKFWAENLIGMFGAITVTESLAMQEAGALLVDQRPAADTSVSTVKGAVPMEVYYQKLNAGELGETEVVFFCWIGGGCVMSLGRDKGSGAACSAAQSLEANGRLKGVYVMKYGLAGVAKEKPELIVDPSSGDSTKVISAKGVDVVKDMYDGFEVQLS